MSKVEGESTSIGFISVRKNPELGYFGGLLMLNPFGRPLEFHCTLPLKPSRAQEILYGPTLETFLCGEQIGFALISKAKERPSLLFTDSTSVLSLRNLVSLPVVWVGVDANDRSLVLSQGSEEEDLETFRIEDWEVGLLSSFRADREQVLKSWKSIGSRIDLSEPFGRIDEALQEANPSTRAA